jgi:salicylate hydroxylase
MENDPSTLTLFQDSSLQMWMGPGRHIVGCSVPKQGIYDIQFTDREYGSGVHGETGIWNERIQDLTWLRSRFEDFHPAIRTILLRAESCWKWRLAEIPALPSWISENGRVVLLGDAAHAMLPHAGQVTKFS